LNGDGYKTAETNTSRTERDRDRQDRTSHRLIDWVWLSMV